MLTPLISLKNISTRIGESLILENSSWDILPQENWAIIGPNGSGKTLLTQVLCRRRPVVAGKYACNEDFLPPRDIALVSFESQKNVLLQEEKREHSRYFSGSTLAFTGVGALLQETDKTESNSNLAHFDGVLRLTNILHLKDRNILRLSTGEFRKVLIARALLENPKLLILDEPLEGLDPQARKQIVDLINRLIAQKIQIVMVTHRINELPEKVDNIICLKDGRIVKSGHRKEMLDPKALKILYGTNLQKFDPGAQSYNLTNSEMRSKTDTLIVMKNVGVRFCNHVIFENLNWTVKRGENWRIIGPNGSGKSTLLSLISGDAPQAYANEIYLFGKRRGSGESIWDIKQRIGMISSEFQLRYQRSVSVFDVILSGFFDSVGLYRHADADKKDIAQKWLDRIGFRHRAGQHFSRLSFGEQKLVLIARAMVKSPELLILDEPCQGLDPENRKMVLELIGNIGNYDYNTIIYVTHHIEEKLSCQTKELNFNLLKK